MWHISGVYKKEFVFLVSALVYRALHTELKHREIYL